MGCRRNVPAQESQGGSAVNQWGQTDLLPREKNEMQSLSHSGLGWIKQQLLQGLIKFGALLERPV